MLQEHFTQREARSVKQYLQVIPRLRTNDIMYKLLTRLGCSPACSSWSEQRLVFFTAVWYRVMRHMLHTHQ